METFERSTINRLWGFLIPIILALLIGGCLPVPALTPLPTDTPTPSETPTATVVWFPPTSTWTPIPTIEASPTPDLRPNIGELVFSDDFSNGEGWALGTTPQGSIALGANELTIVITQPKQYLTSVYEGLFLTNFYAEITASPSLCHDLDEYGLIYRYAAAGYFYRFSLSCNGQARLDRIYGGTGGSPQPWLASASIPTGSPSSSRLGVWVQGKVMRFFVDGAFQFEVSDAYLDSGRLGVFARASADTAVTVGFSDLAVYQLGQ